MVGGLLHWLAVHTGTVNEAGPYYGFWSGFGSDLGEITLFAMFATAWHHLNCHEARCWRPGRHPVLIQGCTYRVCRKHHPHHGDGRIAGQYREERK